jgi:unsaturated pyranuronate lyase
MTSQWLESSRTKCNRAYCAFAHEHRRHLSRGASDLLGKILPPIANDLFGLAATRQDLPRSSGRRREFRPHRRIFCLKFRKPRQPIRKERAMTTTPSATADIAPMLLSPPQVSDAPGRGILPNVSRHTAAAPQLYALDAQPVEQISELLRRQYLSGSNSTFVKWIAKKGAVVPLHHHANEQITWITEGAAEVYSQGRRYVMKAGDIMIIPPNVPHEFVFTEDTVDIDIFAPGRQDWLDGTASYYSK